jgi:hypothetical protein
MPRLRLLLSLSLLFVAAGAQAARVIFVDNHNASGDGSYERPFPSIGEAQRSAAPTDIVYVAEGARPYEESVTLQPGQMLIGAAYGLDAARIDLHAVFSEQSVPASTGPGPLIHGGIYAAGDNVIAGCTIAVESGTGISVVSPRGKIDLRKVFVRPGARATAIAISSADFAVAIDGGGIVGEGGNGLAIDGGRAAITIDHFPLRGRFATALSIRARIAGAIHFGSAATIATDDATRDAVSIGDVKGTIVFDAPLQLVTHGGRGLVVVRTTRVTIAGSSRIDATNATALELHDAALDATFERIDARGVAPGVLREGIVIDKSHGRLAIAGDDAHTPGSGGAIRNAQVYGIRIVQSDGFRLANVDIIDSGTSAAPCPEDVVANTNVRCAAGLYLRHLDTATFANVRITGGAVGVNTNNVRNITFDALDVRGTGATATDAAMLMQESSGTITLARCNIADGSGGQLAIEQRFHPVSFVIDRCTIGAPQRPTASAALVALRAAGAASVDVRIDATTLRENAGSAIDAVARDTSSVRIAIAGSFGQSLGGSFVSVSAQQTATARLAMHGTRVVAPGSARPLVTMMLADAARGCVDVSANDLVGAATLAPVALTARSPQSQLQLVGNIAGAAIDAAVPPALVDACR